MYHIFTHTKWIHFNQNYRNELKFIKKKYPSPPLPQKEKKNVLTYRTGFKNNHNIERFSNLIK